MKINKKVAILQSNYIPWKGYFDLIASVDEFILYDEMQYTKRDWRNRNKIKTPNGLLWLTIPVIQKDFLQTINGSKISDRTWSRKHFKSLKGFYTKAKYYKFYENLIVDLYDQVESELYLSNINKLFITEICKILGIETKISSSTDYNMGEGKTERLINLCQQSGATEYISGPAAKDYIQEELFDQKNIALTWMNYSSYKEYNQLYPPFEHGVSILDLIFNEGPNSRDYMIG